jgi:hypothetical protein
MNKIEVVEYTATASNGVYFQLTYNKNDEDLALQWFWANDEPFEGETDIPLDLAKDLAKALNEIAGF